MHGKRGDLTDRSLKLLTSIVLSAALFFSTVPRVFAYTPYLGPRSDRISDSTASAMATHVISLTFNIHNVNVGSIKLEFCSNDPIPENPCIAPVGFDATTATLSSQGGEVGFTIGPGSNSNTIILTRVPAQPGFGLSTYIFDNIKNPSATGSYYLRMQSFSSIDATGIPIEEGGAVFVIVPGLNINTEVPPYLKFCAAVTIDIFDCSTATSFFIDMGEFRTNQTSKGSSQFLIQTNAQFGYSVTINGTTLTSGINSIPALAAQTSPTPGTSQFGINTVANTNPAIGDDPTGPGTAGVSAGYNIPNQYKYQSGDTLVSVATSNDNRKFTVSYIANINAAQPAGYYTTTLSFICLANF